MTPPPSVRRRLNFGQVAGGVARAVGRAGQVAVRNTTVGRALAAAKFGGVAYRMYKSARKPVAKKQSSRRGSHMNSKATGFFKNPVKRTTEMDRIAEAGIVNKIESGSVVTSTRDVTYIAHSTMPQFSVAKLFVKSLLKKLYNTAGIKIKNEEVPVMPALYYNQEVHMLYKAKDGAVVSVEKWTVTSASTLLSITNDIVAFFTTRADANTLPTQYLNLRLFTQYGTLVTSLQLLADIDLTHVTFLIKSQSYLKVQNRTINSTGNDTSEDVDNVPIYGKYFDFNTNGTIFRDYAEPATGGSSAITTQRTFGVLPSTIATDTNSNMYKELPLSSQFIGCKGQGKAHLDPGEIKTSVMHDSVKIGLQKLIAVLWGKPASVTTAGQFQQYWIGKTRLFGFEKMIQAVATDSTNQFNLAYEHQLFLACVALLNQKYHTAPLCINYTGTIS